MNTRSVYIKVKTTGYSHEGEPVEVSVTKELGVEAFETNDINYGIAMEVIDVLGIIRETIQVDINDAKVKVGGKPYGNKTHTKTQVNHTAQMAEKNPKTPASNPFANMAGKLKENSEIPKGF